MRTPTSYSWLCLGCILTVALSFSCVRPQRVIDRYAQQYSLMAGKPYHAILEYVQERESGDSFAVATIAPSSVAIRSRVHLSFSNQLFTIDGQEYRAADLKGKLLVWQDDEKRVVTLPDGFSRNMAEDRISQMLDELNRNEVE